MTLQEKTKSNFLQRSGVQAAPRQLRKRGQDCYNTVEKEETSRQKKGKSSLTADFSLLL
jgi:hypothetical protein